MSSPGRSGGRRGKKRELATTSPLRRCEMLIGADDISNDVNTLGTCFSMFAYILARFRFASRQGATGELEVDFKFQRHSCKLSFLFPPRRQSTPESLLASYFCSISEKNPNGQKVRVSPLIVCQNLNITEELE